MRSLAILLALLAAPIAAAQPQSANAPVAAPADDFFGLRAGIVVGGITGMVAGGVIGNGLDAGTFLSFYTRAVNTLGGIMLGLLGGAVLGGGAGWLIDSALSRKEAPLVVIQIAPTGDGYEWGLGLTGRF